MKYVKTDRAIYLTIGSETEIITHNDARFRPVLELLKNDADDKDIIWALYGDVISKAKNMLSHLGERTIT